MKNKYIEVVKKWLADNDSVNLENLVENSNAAQKTYFAAFDASEVACEAAEAAAAAVAAATAALAAADADRDVANWVERYEELTNDEID